MEKAIIDNLNNERVATLVEKEFKTKCNSTIEFGDDFGDNETTFHCQLEKGHKGKHKEKGNMYGKTDYVLEWEELENGKRI